MRDIQKVLGLFVFLICAPVFAAPSGKGRCQSNLVDRDHIKDNISFVIQNYTTAKLLTRSEEFELAKKIEEAEKKIYEVLLSTSVGRKAILDELSNLPENITILRRWFRVGNNPALIKQKKVATNDVLQRMKSVSRWTRMRRQEVLNCLMNLDLQHCVRDRVLVRLKKRLSDKKVSDLANQIQPFENDIHYHQSIFVTSNLRMAIDIAKGYRNRGVDFNELIQQGVLGLITASKKFSYKMNCKFSTHAYRWVNTKISRFVEYARTIKVPVNEIRDMKSITEATAVLVQKLHRPPNVDEIANELGWEVSKVLFVKQHVENRAIFFEDLAGNKDFENLLGSDFNSQDLEISKKIDLESAVSILNHIMSEVLKDRERTVLEFRFGFSGLEPKTLEEIGKMWQVSRQRIRQIEQQGIQKIKKYLKAHPSLVDSLVL